MCGTQRGDIERQLKWGTALNRIERHAPGLNRYTSAGCCLASYNSLPAPIAVLRQPQLFDRVMRRPHCLHFMTAKIVAAFFHFMLS
jgi:hypothetical protein